MVKYIAIRVLQMIPVLFGVILVVFIITHVIPGDPVLLMLGPGYTEKEYNDMKTYLGLDKSLTEQFVSYVGGLAKGDLGKTIKSRELVTTVILRRFPATLTLSLVALIIATVIAIPIGIVSALKQNTKIDYISMIAAQVGISMPVFWLGIMLILFLSIYLDILPVSGRGDPPDLTHLILPACCFATPFIAMTARLTRSCMLEVLRENYIVAARSRGFSESRVVFKHALKNAMIPVITNLGLQLSRMLGGALVIEVVFRWPGMGELAYDAIMERDYAVVMGVVLITAVTFIVINLLVDLSYTFLDPRIKYNKKMSEG